MVAADYYMGQDKGRRPTAECQQLQEEQEA